MKTKITLVGARLSLNFGGPSLLAATKTVLDAYFDNAEYTLIIPYKTIALDQQLAPQYGVSVLPFRPKIWTIPMVIVKRWLRLLAGPADQKAIIRNLAAADVVIDIWGIMHADSLHNTFMFRLLVGLHLWMAKFLGKPVIKYTTALGPFEQKWNRLFARFYLGRNTDLVLVRDNTSFASLEKLQLGTPAFVIPDTAFLLPAQDSAISAEIAQTSRNKPVVCLSVSYQARNREKSAGAYTASMAHLIRHITTDYQAQVVLLPNELSSSPDDDIKVGRHILEQLGETDCRLIDTEKLTAAEIKGIIRECSLVVAARYHTIVAALSLGIPTLAIAWHHKYREVLGLFAQEEWLCNIDELSDTDLTARFDALWQQQEKSRVKIAHYLPQVKESIMQGGQLVQELLNKSARR
ncbi:MAG TPA: polysaccharide pyruvyl transferase family protein [bacterium]|nr:polysaccharide pyruvyl transferase family protein [bacterium]HPN42530.1 polysaccharide pyruvyl transferase family protein [bacterium]